MRNAADDTAALAKIIGSSNPDSLIPSRRPAQALIQLAHAKDRLDAWTDLLDFVADWRARLHAKIRRDLDELDEGTMTPLSLLEDLQAEVDLFSRFCTLLWRRR
jgi:hypothetical protein